MQAAVSCLVATIASFHYGFACLIPLLLTCRFEMYVLGG